MKLTKKLKNTARYFWKHYKLAIVLLIAAFIVLPSGTPDDLLTTAVIIKIIGLRYYLILALTIIGLLIAVLHPKISITKSKYSSIRF